MNNICDCFKKVPRIPRGNDFKFILRLVEQIVVGFHQVEEREVQGTVNVTSVLLYNSNGVVEPPISEGSASNGTNTYSINNKNTIVICFNKELSVGKYGIEVLFTVSHENSEVVEDRRFYAPPGYGFYIVESTPEGFIPSDKVMTYEIAANLGLGTLVDLSGYPTNQQLTEALNGKVDKVNGKGLTKNEFTDEYKEKVDSTPLSVGYFLCDTNASTAAKTVTANGYKLQSGGAIKIKMTNGNTASNPTMNINATGVKPIYYNGAIASPTNSWEAGEVIEVYYDGTNYQATNFQGGGGNADKIKYDNTQSGMTADNAQAAIDELKNELTELAVGGITLSASATPSVIEVGETTSVTIKGTASKAIDTLNVIYGGTTQSANTATSVQKAISVTPSAKTTYNFTVTGTHKGVAVKSATGHFYSTYRTYVGAGTTAVGVVSGGQDLLALSISTTFNVPFVNADYLFIVTPLNVTSIKDEFGGAVGFTNQGKYNTNWNIFRSNEPMLAGVTAKFTIIAN